MLDNIMNTVKRSAERVQRRGEEVAQVARLRVEVFQLTRELDGHYARLGRAYHAGAEPDLLQGVRADIRRAEEEIRSRERLIDELGGAEQPVGEGGQASPGPAQSGGPAATPTAPPNSSLDNRPPFTEQLGGLTPADPASHSAESPRDPAKP